MRDVIIDIGHYGADSGAVNGNYKEVDFNKSISDKLVNILKNEYKLDVITSQGTLSERVRVANENRTKAFVSIHCNAGGGTGFESWIYASNSPCERLASSINEELGQAISIRNRGVKTNNFYILKESIDPAVIVECGFMDSSDLEILKTKQNEIARGIAKGITKYLGVSTSSPSTSDKYVVEIPAGTKTIEIRLQ